MSSSLKLVGHIAGDHNAFVVTIQASDMVHDLKKAVKVDKSPELDHIAADRLTIYKLGDDAGVDSSIIRKNGLSVRDHDAQHIITELEACLPIYGYWPSTPQPYGVVHFVVELPQGKPPGIQVKITIKHQDVGHLFRSIKKTFPPAASVQDLKDYLDTLASPPPNYNIRIRHNSMAGGFSSPDTEAPLNQDVEYQVQIITTPPATPVTESLSDVFPLFYRSRTLKTVLEAVWTHRVVSLRSPPGTGKTTLARQILQRYGFLFHDVKLVNLSVWPYHMTTLEEYIANKAPFLLDLETLRAKPTTTLVLIHGAQALNWLPSTHAFWGAINDAQGQSVGSLFVIMLNVFGDDPSSAIWTFSPCVAMPICVPTLDFNVLMLDSAEYQVAVERYNAFTKGVRLHQGAINYIHNFLGGHIGLISQLLYYLDTNITSQSLRAQAVEGGIQTEVLNFIARIMPILSPIPSLRYEQFVGKATAYAYVQQMVQTGGTLPRTAVSSDEEMEAINFLISQYHITPIANGWSFPSPFVHYKLLADWNQERTHKLSFDQLVKDSIRNMDLMTISRSGSTKVTGSVLEDPFKCSLYLAIYGNLNGCSRCDPEVGKFFHSKGGIDLWIMPGGRTWSTSPGWAIEILSNSDSLQEHIDRFQPNGIYKDIPFSDYVLLNFVQEVDVDNMLLRKKARNDQKVWHIHWDRTHPYVILRRHGCPDEKLIISQSPLPIPPNMTSCRNEHIPRPTNDV